jgi:hypothetical protein
MNEVKQASAAALMNELKELTPARPDKELDTLADDIKAEVGKFYNLLGSALERAVKAGELLERAKEVISTRTAFQWSKWVEEKTGLTYRHASNFIRLYTEREYVREKLMNDPNPTVTKALNVLRKPRGKDEDGQPKPKPTPEPNPKPTADPVPVALAKAVRLQEALDTLLDLTTAPEQWAAEIEAKKEELANVANGIIAALKIGGADAR